MRSVILPVLLILTAAFSLAAQTPDPPKKIEGPPAPSVQTAPTPASKEYVRLDAKQRRSRYYKSMFGVGAIGKNIASAGWGTYRNTTKEWGPHWEGFAKRVASGFGKSVIKNTTAYALEEAFDLDSRFFKSKKRDTASKIKNALVSPFIARNKEGKKVFGFPRLVGTYASSVIAAEVWYPKNYNWKDGLRSGTVSIGTNIFFNLVKEFFRR